MTNKSTKQKILDAAVRLFNEHGMVNTRLQHIADEVGISVGNLAYHYVSKKAIIQAVHEQLSEIIEPILSNNRSFPNLIDFDNQLSVYYHLSKSYSFYFLDLLEIERGYPQIHAARITQLDKIITQIEMWLSLSIKNGLIKREATAGQYKKVANIIWVITHFWMAQAITRGKEPENEGKFKSAVWTIIEPYFSETGKSEYEMLILPNISNFIN